jgi:preprotein translocase subunit SecA
MDQLRAGIGLRGLCQRDPVIEFKFEGMDMFDEMVAAIKEDTVKHIFHARLAKDIKREQLPSLHRQYTGKAEVPAQKAKRWLR